MAVTLTVPELLAALRLGSTEAETAQATRLLEYGRRAVEKHVAICPDEIHNESCIRLCAYLFDAPSAGRGAGFAHAMRNSGAAAVLMPYRVHRAGSVAEAVQAAQEAVGTPGNPVTNVTVSGSVLTITFADGSTRNEDLPAGGNGATFIPAVPAATEGAAGVVRGADQCSGNRRKRYDDLGLGEQSVTAIRSCDSSYLGADG